MRVRPLLVRCATFFLLLVFSQKTGVDLLLHNLLHAGKTDNVAFPEKDTNNEFSYACSCIDDFLTPYTEAGEPFIPFISDLPVAGNVFLSIQAPSHDAVYSPLRGPPSLLL